MKEHISKHTFDGAMNYDSSNRGVAKKDVRDAVNTDTTEPGKEGLRVNMLGTLEAATYTDQNTDKPTLNVLGVADVFARYDYDGDGEFEVENPSVLILTWDKNNLSRILLFDATQEQVSVLYDSVASGDIGFPPTGTASISYDKEQGRNYAYWDDAKNKLRKIPLEYSYSPGWQRPTARSIETERPSAGGAPDLVEVRRGGSLVAGGYQVAYRYFSSNRCEASGWSSFTNPIPIIRSDVPDEDPNGGDEYLGAGVGEVVDQQIVFSISHNQESQFYDSVQLAVVKHVDGTNVPPTIAYITEARKEWYNSPGEIRYDGTSAGEVEVPIELIVVDDAAIAHCKTNTIKENIMFRGGVKYFELEMDNGDIEVGGAETIEHEIQNIVGSPYKIMEQTHDIRGYFRGECYAFGGVYHDEYGNYGAVQPFDLSAFYKEARRPGAAGQVTSSSPLPDPVRSDVYAISMIMPGSVEVVAGDYIEVNGNVVQVAAVSGGGVYRVHGNPGTIFPAPAYKLLGQEGNQSEAWSWKFPSREDNKFTILNEDGMPTALGLRLMGIKNHPSWARGFAVVRQKRKKNVLYQSPVINLVAAMGVPTPGIGPIGVEADEPDDSRADYKGEKDCLVPKVFSLGAAKNFIKKPYFFDHRQSQKYAIYLPVQVPQTQDEGMVGSEAPRHIAIVPPAYMFNHVEEPYYNHVFVGGERVEIVDAVALRRRRLVGVDTEDNLSRVNVFSATHPSEYFYSRAGKTISGFQVTYFRKVYDIENPLYSKVSAPPQVVGSQKTTLSQSNLLLTQPPFATSLMKDINYFGSLSDLSASQGESNAVPAATDSFFNQVENQRMLLMELSEKMYDFTLAAVGGIFAGDNYFPGILSGFISPSALFSPSNQVAQMGFCENTTAGGKDNVWVEDEDGNQAVDLLCGAIPSAIDGSVASCAHIVNVTRGLGDNRYQKNSSEWYATGAYVALSESDVQNNTPIDMDVFGGDCFLTKASIKVNNNTPRISNQFDTIEQEAKDYYLDLGIRDKSWHIRKVRKLGTFENNVEFVEVYLESEVNTGYYQQPDEYPAFSEVGDENLPGYSKSYLLRYNFGYSAQNELKKFASQINDCVENNGRYPARYVWSEGRVYQAETNEFVYVDGFGKYPVANRKDLDEKYGAITAVVDFGDDGLHVIQERKVRFDPVNRAIIQDAGGTLTTVLGTSVVGQGGFYLPFDNGSQHIRTVKHHSGVCFFVDARKRQVIMFSSKGGNMKAVSDLNMVGYFMDMLGVDGGIPEHLLSGHIDYRPNNSEYWIVKRPGSGTKGDTIIFSSRTPGFKTRFDAGSKHVIEAISCDKSFYLLDDSSVYKAYANPMRGFFFGNYNNSEVVFVPNEMSELVKTIDSARWYVTGQLIPNKDKLIVVVDSEAGVARQESFDCFSQRGDRPVPVQMRNFQYFSNWIRNKENKARLFGRTAEFRLTIVNEPSQNNREVGLEQVEVYMTTSYPNR